MRALIVLDVDIDEGQRPGTRFARLEWVAGSLAQFAQKLRRIRRLNRISVHPEHAAAALPSQGIIEVEIPPHPTNPQAESA